MIVRIKDALEQINDVPRWYDECCGQYFFAVKFNHLIYFAAKDLPILASDCEVIENSWENEKKIYQYQLKKD